MDKYKVFWISDLVVPTGFSRVAHGILKHLDLNKFDITCLGINYNGDPHEYPFKIYPAGLGGDPYGLSRLKGLLKMHNPDLIFILQDAWVIADYLTLIKKEYEGLRLPKIITYFPVDAEPHNPDWYKNFDVVNRTASYTQFAKRVVEKEVPWLNIEIINHGVDSEDFYYGNKEDAKRFLFGDKGLDYFVFLNANRNQPRKTLEVAIEGFKLFSENKPLNVKYYSHCGVEDSYINIDTLFKRLGISNRLLLTSPRRGAQTVPVNILNTIYNACDVGVNCGIGEGWGLTNMEHALTGAPQVVSDHSALHELYHDIGILVPANIPYMQKIMTVGKKSYAEDFAEAFETIYQDHDLYNKLSKLGVEKFSSTEYSWKTVSKKFETMFLEELE